MLLGIGLFLILFGYILGMAVTETLINTGGVVGMEKVAAEVKPAWKGGDTLDTKMIEKLKAEFGEERITYTVNTSTPQQTEGWSGKKVDAAVIGADSTYSMFHSFKFLHGGFFPPARKAGALKTAVISGDIAWTLFRTTDAVGMELMLYGEAFKITGVFKSPEDILHILVRDGSPDILIPAETMLALDDNAHIGSVELTTDDSVIFGGNTERIFAALRLAGANTSRFNVTDFVTGLKSIAQRPMLLIFMAGFITVLLCSTHIVRTITGLIRDMWRTHLEYDLTPSRSVWYKSGLKLVLPALVITVLVLLWQQSNFKFYLPAEFIPGEALEQQKYQELLQEGLRQIFYGIDEEASVNVRLFQAAGLLSGALFRTSLFAGFLLTVAGLTALFRRPFEEAVGKTGVLQVAALLAACGLCRSFGLPVRICTEGVLVLWTFVVTCLIVSNQEHRIKNEGSVVIV